jgi:hypothetical protein
MKTIDLTDELPPAPTLISEHELAYLIAMLQAVIRLTLSGELP